MADESSDDKQVGQRSVHMVRKQPPGELNEGRKGITPPYFGRTPGVKSVPPPNPPKETPPPSKKK